MSRRIVPWVTEIASIMDDADSLPEIRRRGACGKPNANVDMEATGLNHPNPQQNALCESCVVLRLCRQYGLENDPSGLWDDVWGGLTGNQRRSINAARTGAHCPGAGGTAVLKHTTIELCLGCGI